MTKNPGRPRLIPDPTTTHILRNTAKVIFTRRQILHFLILTFTSLFVHTRLENNAHSLVTFTDNDPSFKSLFPPLPKTHFHNDFFIVNEKMYQRYFEKSLTKTPQSNSTPIILDSFNAQLGYSTSILSFKSVESNNRNDRKTEIEQQDLNVLHAFRKYAFSYGWMFLLYVASQSILHGIIFVLVVNHMITRSIPFMNTYRRGLIMGLNRVWWIFILRNLLMQVVFQILTLWFVRCEDRYTVFKILIRTKFLPFSIAFTEELIWVKGFELEILGFFISYICLDMLVSYVFGVCVWVAMADSRKTCMVVFREGFHLLSLLLFPAVILKVLEIIVCMSFTKSVLSKVVGEFLGPVIQSFILIYLMVAWLMYHFSVKAVDAHARGDRYRKRQFADMLDNN